MSRILDLGGRPIDDVCLRLQLDGLRSRVRRQGQRSLASPRSRVCDDIVTASCAKALRRGSNSGKGDCSSPFASASTLRAVSPCLHDRNAWFASWRLAWTDERQCDGRKARWGIKGSGGEVAVGRRMRWQSLDGRGVIVGRRDFQNRHPPLSHLTIALYEQRQGCTMPFDDATLDPDGCC